MQKLCILRYETAIKADKFVLMAHGTADQVANAKEMILKTTKPASLDEHSLEPAKLAQVA